MTAQGEDATPPKRRSPSGASPWGGYPSDIQAKSHTPGAYMTQFHRRQARHWCCHLCARRNGAPRWDEFPARTTTKRRALHVELRDSL